MKPGEAVSVAAKWTMMGAFVVLLASVLPVACDSNSGGTTCFPPDHGPSDTSCAGFALTLTCPVDVTPWYSCTCTATGAVDGGAPGSAQTWVCAPVTGGGGGGGAGGGGGGGTPGTGGAGGTTTASTTSTTSSATGTGGTSPDAGSDGGP